MRTPRLYAIVDRSPACSLREAATFVEALIGAGVTLLQYRNKQGSPAEMLSEARELKRIAGKKSAMLIMNDRADVCVAAGLGGVHLGQDDLSPVGARLLCPSPKIVGVSTHNLAQLEEADRFPVDYIAFGPVFATSSKSNPDPIVGLDGLKKARNITKKPLVAIGGITAANCRQAIEAGADSVAVISALKDNPREKAEEFLRRLT